MYISDRNFGCRVTAVTLQGYQALVLENRWIRVTVLADKGTDIYEFLYKPADTDFMWRTPFGLRDPRFFVPSSNWAAGNFLDHYPGGWQEMFPVCGNAADYYGLPIGVHGEVCLLPWRWDVEEDTPASVTVRFSVRTNRSPFRLAKWLTMTADTAALFIREEVVNAGAVPVEFMWGHHPAFGPPFVSAGCRIDTDATRVLTSSAHHDPASRLAPDQDVPWPWVRTVTGAEVDLSVVGGPELGTHDWSFLTGFAEGWCALTNPDRPVGFALRWPATVMPYLLYWQVYGGARGSPWFGRNYNVALEPQSTFPADFATGRPRLRLAPGDRMHLDLLAAAYSGLERVAYVAPDGRVRGPGG